MVCTLQREHGMPGWAAAASGRRFLHAFRARPDHERYQPLHWIEMLWADSLPPEYTHIAKSISEEWLKLRFECLALTPDVVELLETLRERYSLALITNGPSRAQWGKVEALRLRPYFECVLVSGDLPWEKPDPRIFHEACRLLRVPHHNCLMVGDKLDTDILGGKQAGLRTAWVCGEGGAERSPLPDYTLPAVQHLPALLARINTQSSPREAARDEALP